MKHGAIVGRDVVVLHESHHIVKYWNSYRGTGRTLCGLYIAIDFGGSHFYDKWRLVNGGQWSIERDCANCMRSLSTLPALAPTKAQTTADSKENNNG